jgi:vacuolar-type H+-ATPase subunit H
MRDVIQKVIEAEGEAKLILKSTREEAEYVLAAARQRAQGIVEQARRETRTEADQILARAEDDVTRQKQERLEQAGRDIQEQIRLDDATRLNAVSAVLRCVRGRQR